MSKKSIHKSTTKNSPNPAFNKNKFWKIALLSVAGLFLIFSLVYFINTSKIGINHSIIEQHAFRQTQTGLTAYYFVKDGFSIDYITPMYGYPWKVPMEFPLYQYAVSVLKKNTSFTLDKSGRITSLLFFYLSLPIIFFILKKMTNNYFASLISISFIFIHPLIIYWSRSFLIESTAIFFNLLFLLIGLKLLDQNKWWWWLISLMISIIAPITKSTTGFTHIMLFGFYLLANRIIPMIRDFKNFDIKKVALDYLPLAFFWFLPALLTTVIWTKHTDEIKNASFTSSFWASDNPTMKAWNYGTFDQKISLDVWSQINGFEFNLLVVVVIVLVITLILKLPNLKTILSFGLAGIAGPLVFTNLYYVHDYYSYANSFFYCITIGLFLSDLLTGKAEFYFKVIGICLTVGMGIYLIKSYKNSYYARLQKSNNNYFSYIGEQLKSKLPEDKSFVFFGMIGDPFVPYYSERKGVCMSPYYVESMRKDTLGFLKTIEKSNIGGIVLCDVQNQDIRLVQKMIDYFSLDPNPANADYQQYGYYIFLKK